jgi:predicted nucleic acid-binding protein
LTLVLDCSFASQVFIPSQRNANVSALLDRFRETDEELVSPSFLQIEFVSSLRRLESRGAIASAESERAWQDLLESAIRFRWDIRWPERALQVSRTIGVSKAYDSLYLACAEALGVELVTCDGRFFRAASPHFPGQLRLA